MRTGRRTESRAARQARQVFTETVLARAGCEVQSLISHRCGGGYVDACHILPKRFIRVETNTWSEPDRLAVLWNPANALRGCRTGHNLFDAPGHGGVGMADLPGVVLVFAERYGWVWKLEHIYRGRVVA